MKKKWTRTSFRIRKADHERLKAMSDRAGYKIKDFLDELINRQFNSGIWDKNDEKEVSEVYKDCLELAQSSRVTFEISTTALEQLSGIQENHKDLNRDQILSIMIFASDNMFAFPLRLERARLRKMRPLVKRIVGLKKRLESDLNKSFHSDHAMYVLLGWDQFIESVNRLDRASEKWSRDIISPTITKDAGRTI